MTIPDCLGGVETGVPILVLCFAICVVYGLIARVWLKAASQYSAPKAKNPWFWQAIIFFACGLAGYASEIISVFSLQGGIFTRLVSLPVILVASTLFLMTIARQSIQLAKNAERGKRVFFIRELVIQGKMKFEDAEKLLLEELNGLKNFH